MALLITLTDILAIIMIVSMPPLHSWPIDPDEAIRLQLLLRERLLLAWDGRPVSSVGGVDVSFFGDQSRAAIVVLGYPELTPLAAVTADAPLRFPYIPGLLAFHEGPAILAAWEKLPFKPDLLLFDGQGIAHPRGFGLAAHMGLWLDTPSIGVAKSLLYGQYARVGPRSGEKSMLRDKLDPERVIGAVLRTRENTNPLFISPGHRMDLEHAVTFTLGCCRGYRLPEPARWAHRVSKGVRLLFDRRP
jgi:deoxyribonuclease V